MSLSQYFIFSHVYGRWLESLSIYWQIRKKRRSRNYQGSLLIDISLHPDTQSEYGWADMEIKTSNCIYTQSPIYSLVNKFKSEKCVLNSYIIHLSPDLLKEKITIEFFGMHNQYEKRVIDVKSEIIRLKALAQNITLNVDGDLNLMNFRMQHLAIHGLDIEEVTMKNSDEFAKRMDNLQMKNLSIQESSMNDFNINNYKPQLKEYGNAI